MSIFAKIVTGVFGKKSEKDLKIFSPYVDEINAAFQPLASLSDQELLNRFQSLREKLEDTTKKSQKMFESEGLKEGDLEDATEKVEQEFLDSIMVEVFAIVKDACRRIYGTEFTVMRQKMKWEMIPFDVQLIGGVVLHRGKIAEMKTGEGKTLVSTMPIILNAITGRGVHVITVNSVPHILRLASLTMANTSTILELRKSCSTFCVASSRSPSSSPSDLNVFCEFCDISSNSSRID